MSRSDGTDKRNVTGLEHRWQTWSLPAGTGRYLRRKWQKRQRQAERAALHQGREPEPARPRHSVNYDFW
jgi:hypothetical protein